MLVWVRRAGKMLTLSDIAILVQAEMSSTYRANQRQFFFLLLVHRHTKRHWMVINRKYKAEIIK